MSDGSERVVPVVIQGLRYPVRSTLDPTYVAELAAYVDEKMRLASEANDTTDFLRVADARQSTLCSSNHRPVGSRPRPGGTTVSVAPPLPNARTGAPS